MSIQLNYEMCGSGDPTTVFIHGVGSNADVWNPIMASLPNRRLLAYDLRGHGNSPVPAPPYQIDDFINDHVNLMRTLDIGPVNLVGFSLGSLIAQGVAIHYPQTIKRLVLIGSVADRTSEEQARVFERLRLLTEQGPEAVAKASVHRWFTEDFLARHPEVYDQTVKRMAGLNKDAYLAAYRVLAETDFACQLRRIHCPTLAITGENDVGSTPRMSETIAQRVVNGRAVIIKHAKHSVLMEQPKQIADLIRNFIE